MRLVIVGGGMLATALRASAARAGLTPLWADRSLVDVALIGSVNDLTHQLAADDIVINCAGRRPPAGAIESVLTNSLGPHILANALAPKRIPMIQISTDCVFSGWERRNAPRRHLVDETPNPNSLYGRTKLAGEVDSPLVWNVRTSFVGPDHGLWQWIASREDNETVEGWSEAWWSGSTVWEVADKLIELSQSLPIRHHMIHLATTYAITKLDAVTLIAAHLKKPLKIAPTAVKVDRSLAATYVIHPLAYALGERALQEVS